MPASGKTSLAKALSKVTGCDVFRFKKKISQPQTGLLSRIHILLGSHTKLKAGKWYAGSVVEQAGSTAGCPVVVVNDPEALHPWEDIAPPARDIMPVSARDLHMFDRVSHI